MLVATRLYRVFGNLGDPTQPKAGTLLTGNYRYGEEPFYKETKGKEAGRESEETIVPIEGNAT